MDKKIDINQKVIKMIKDAKNRKMEHIVFGDFNLRYELYKKAKEKNAFCNKALRFFKKLEDLNLWDIHKELYDMDNRGIISTFISKGDKNNTRIDYIWASENIFQETSDAKIRKIEGILTDHKILTFSFLNQGLVNVMPEIKKFRNKKVLYNYDETEENDKTAFSENLIEAVKDWNNNWSIEEKWKYYKKTLTINKQKFIKKKELFIRTVKQQEDITQLDLYKSIRYIIFLRRNIKKYSGRMKLKENWRRYQWHLKKHLEKLDEEAPNNYYLTRCFEVKKIFLQYYILELNEMYDKFYKKLFYELNKMKDEKIKSAVERRCEDLKDNQQRMIDSVTENEIRKIIIDRVVIQNEKNEDILITDPDEIKKVTIKHFQEFAGSHNRNVEITQDWCKDYEPIEEIQEGIYDDILKPITDNEWKELIGCLPMKKACRPTNIAYEDIKNAPDDFNILLRNLINDVFLTQNIPLDWKNANIYPIPKPKPWKYRLVNTRPITLLEIPRKAMMKIITKRLSKIIKDFKVLKGLQYAGLPLNSTFEPLRIINEIIQHANERDKELWVLALDMSKAYDRINIHMLDKAMQRIKIPKELRSLLTGLFLDRKNRVFTPGGLTDPYDMKVGIDQGEIISPLLWIIYYDPLLTTL